MEVKGKGINLQVWDTAGQERYRSLTHQFYAGADGVILVYDCTNRESFNRLQGWVKSIHEVCGMRE